MINNQTLAFLCNDVMNSDDYKIIGDNCYYKGDFIGKIKGNINGNYMDIYFKPVIPVKHITVNFTLSK